MAQVSKVGKLEESLVANHGWQSDSTAGLTNGWTVGLSIEWASTRVPPTPPSLGGAVAAISAEAKQSKST